MEAVGLDGRPTVYIPRAAAAEREPTRTDIEMDIYDNLPAAIRMAMSDSRRVFNWKPSAARQALEQGHSVETVVRFIIHIDAKTALEDYPYGIA